MIDSAERLARNLDWNLLRTFMVIARSGSITQAATTLRLKQPTVSSALKRLEDHLDRKLVVRTPGHFHLTEAGKMLYEETVEIYGSILRLDTIMREITDAVRGHVRIAMASHVTCPLLDQALSDFHEEHPNATLSIDIASSRESLAAVNASQASFAVCLVRDRNPRLEYRRLFREFFGLFCGPKHPLFGRSDLTKSDLAGQSSVSFITDQMSEALRPVSLLRAELALDDRVVATSANLEEVRRLIVAGLGVGPLPLHVVGRDLRDGILWQLPPYDSLPAIDVHVVWNPKAKMNRAEQALLAKLLHLIEMTPIEQRTYSLETMSERGRSAHLPLP
ncbi:LysR family transcriptional regulator [Pseudovibrio exalbescens]|uniref:LysR family transcriptional regulator n=1 Tax=Pseudovibrio exalbescens TaxID=197461 RepID=UPI000427706D|nr:LysR family transcriptional regulator [Pseudovibrio exalbescens]